MWTEEDYWQKSRLYIRRAQSAGGDDSLYPFWMSLALEFIARAALSKVSPVLNADVRDVENIYFALGLTEVGTPKTIPLHSVFGRCVTVVDGFEGRHKNFCGFLGTQRNEELAYGQLTLRELEASGLASELLRGIGHSVPTPPAQSRGHTGGGRSSIGARLTTG